MNRRDEILAAAAEVFAHHGFRGSTTRRIADAAGVNEITIFRQFGSKEALLREAMKHMTESAGLVALPEIPSDPELELTGWSEAYIQHLRLRSSMIRKTMSEIEERPEWSECASYVPTQQSNDLCRYLVALRKQGRIAEKFDPKTATAMLMGAIFADAMGRDVMPDLFPQPAAKAAQQYTLLLLRALGVEIGSRRTTSKQTKRTKQLSA
jgi:AcrR family transcriptional regulator